jgi:predicted DNA-binding transcriptional regulator AlpA
LEDVFLTAKQICDERQISLNSLYRYIRAGYVPKGQPAGLRAVRWRRSVIDNAFANMQRSKVGDAA